MFLPGSKDGQGKGWAVVRKTRLACVVAVSAVAVLGMLSACGSIDSPATEDGGSTSVVSSAAVSMPREESSSVPVERHADDTSSETSRLDASRDAAETAEAYGEEPTWQEPEAAAASYAAAASGSQQASSDGGNSQQTADAFPVADASRKASDSSQQQSSNEASPKNDSSQSDGAKPATEPKQKKWVDPVYETVEHPEEGHYESVVVGQRYFCLCGQEVDSPEGWKQHRADFIASNGGKCNGQHVSYTMEDIVEEQYVVDSPAWSEKVLASEGHWE